MKPCDVRTCGQEAYGQEPHCYVHAKIAQGLIAYNPDLDERARRDQRLRGLLLMARQMIEGREGEEMIDPARTAAEDQLEAHTAALLESLGLEAIATSSPDPAWMETLTAETYFDHELMNAANINAVGHLWVLIAVKQPTSGDIAAHYVEVGRRPVEAG